MVPPPTPTSTGGIWSDWRYVALFFMVMVYVGLKLFAQQKKLAAKPEVRKREHYEGPSDNEGAATRTYTSEELAEFLGEDGTRPYVSVFGKVYSADPQWYGPEGPYKCFAGTDATVSLGKMQITRDNANIPLSKVPSLLSESEMQTAKEWAAKLESKYRFVGHWIGDTRDVSPTATPSKPTPTKVSARADGERTARQRRAARED